MTGNVFDIHEFYHRQTVGFLAVQYVLTYPAQDCRILADGIIAQGGVAVPKADEDARR